MLPTGVGLIVAVGEDVLVRDEVGVTVEVLVGLSELVGVTVELLVAEIVGVKVEVMVDDGLGLGDRLGLQLCVLLTVGERVLVGVGEGKIPVGSRCR